MCRAKRDVFFAARRLRIATAATAATMTSADKATAAASTFGDIIAAAAAESLSPEPESGVDVPMAICDEADAGRNR